MKKWFGVEGYIDYSNGWLRVGRYWLGVWRGRPRLVPVIAGGTSANTTQEDFWFRNDDGSLTTATYISTQNSNYAPTLSANQKVRIRIIAEEQNGKNDPWAFQLGAQKNGTGGYTLITTTRTDGIRYADDGNSIADGTTISTADFDLTWTGTAQDGEYDDAQTSAGTGTIALNGTYCELEFCVELVFNDLTDADYFDLQLLSTASGALNGYTRTPRITVTKQAIISGTATLAGSGTLTAAAQVVRGGAATLAGTGTLTAVGAKYVGEVVRIDFEEGDKTDFESETNATYMSVSGTAAQVGSYGLECDLTTAAGADFHGHNALTIENTQINYRIYVDPNDLSMATNTRLAVAVIRTDGTVGGVSTIGRLIIRDNAGTMEAAHFSERDDGTSATVTTTMPGSPWWFEGEIIRATNSTSADGEHRLYINGSTIGADTNLDNYDLFATITEVRTGADDLDVATTGTIYLDDLVVRDDGQAIGAAEITHTATATLAGAGTLTAAPSVTRAVTAQLDGAGALTAVPAITRAVTATLAGSGTITAVGTVGVIYPWCDGFESGDTSAWTGTTGSPTINGTAAMEGSYGMEVSYSQTNDYVYRQWTNSTHQVYRMSFYVNKNNIAGSGGQGTNIINLQDGVSAVGRVQLLYNAVDGIVLRVAMYDDTPTWQTSANNILGTGDVFVEVEFLFTDTNGYANIWLDGVLGSGVSTVDTGTRYPDEVRFGSQTGFAFTSGTFYLDSFCLYDTLRPIQGTATLSGAGTLTAAPSVTRSVTATLQGAGTLQAVPAVTRAVTATLAGQGTLTAVGAIVGAVNSGAILNGVGGLVAAGVVVRTGTATLDGAGALVAVGTVQTAAINGAAVLAGQGGLSAQPAITRAVVAVLDGSGALVAAGSLVHAGSAVLAGTGTLTASASLLGTVTAAAVLAGAGTMQAIPAVTRSVAALLAGQGTLTATAQNYKNAVATLDGQGGVTAQAAVLHAALAVLAGFGTLTARGSFYYDVYYFDPDKNVFATFRDKRTYVEFRDKRKVVK